MECKSFFVESLKHNVGFVTHTLGDFTDADMFARPCPKANHAAWQLGHLLAVECGVHEAISPVHAVSLPDGFKDLFNMKANANDDPAHFAPFNTKSQLLDLFNQVRSGTIACVESMSPAQLDTPSPERFKSWAPTLGALIAGLSVHTLMHVGQFQVIRRKLGKPVLF